jgi:CheY-like chemotaxis protein/DNA-binding XRE family transcriptional regulator
MGARSGKTNVKREFGATVRAYRRQLGISQETLAQRAELHRTYVTDVERGARNISLVSISRLAQALDLSISSLFSPPRPTASERRKLTARFHKGVEILLVEDDPKDLELTLEAFKSARLSNPVEVVTDGQAALDFLFCSGPFAHRAQADGRTTIVLLDLHLPKLHGLEVLRRLRADQRTSALQVVILTTSRDDANVNEALRLGAEAFIVKPLDFQSLSSVTPRLDFWWTLLNPSDQASRSPRSKLPREQT